MVYFRKEGKDGGSFKHYAQELANKQYNMIKQHKAVQSMFVAVTKLQLPSTHTCIESNTQTNCLLKAVYYISGIVGFKVFTC